MAINRSRFRRNVDWDGPQVARRKHILSEADTWKKRFVMTLTLALFIIVILLVALGILYYKYRKAAAPAAVATQSTQTVSLKTYTNKDVGVTLQYPEDWQVKTNTPTTDLDIINVAFSKKNDAANVSYTLDVIKNQDSMTLDAWVKRFGVQNIQTTSSTVAGHTALVAAIQNSNGEESQTITYVSEGKYIYVLDMYRLGKDDALEADLAKVAQSFAFTAPQATAPSTPAPTTSSTASSASRVIISTVVSSKVDSFLSFANDGADSKEIFSDKNEKVYFKNVGTVVETSGMVYGYFGASQGTANEGIYALDGTSAAPKLTAMKKGITPGVIRATADGKSIAYLDGPRGSTKTIVIMGSDGKTQHTVNASANVVDFDIARDGSQIAYAVNNSGKISIVSNTGQSVSSVTLSTKNVLRFDWSESNNLFAFVVDAGTTLTNKSELLYGNGTNNKQLTSDSFVQDLPQIADDGKNVYYESYSAAPTPKISIWKIGVDGSADTNILKGKNQILLGITNALS